MIHFNKIAAAVAEREKEGKGRKVILKVSGMKSPGKDRDGEPIPPKIANGTLVAVIETDVDSVTVAEKLNWPAVPGVPLSVLLTCGEPP